MTASVQENKSKHKHMFCLVDIKKRTLYFLPLVCAFYMSRVKDKGRRATIVLVDCQMATVTDNFQFKSLIHSE